MRPEIGSVARWQEQRQTQEIDPLSKIRLGTIIAVVTLQGFVLGKLDLLTVSLGKLKFASVTDFSLSKLPRESFIVWGSKTAREQKNALWISLDNYPKAEKGKNQIPE